MTPCAKYFCTNGYSTMTGRLETMTETYLSWLASLYCSRMVSPLPPVVVSDAMRISRRTSYKGYFSSVCKKIIALK